MLNDVTQLEQEIKALKLENNYLESWVEVYKDRLETKDRIINQLETNRDEAIEYIKHSWWLRLDQVYDTSKNLQGWEVEELLSILERGKE